MLQVEILEEESCYKLERKINEKLNEFSRREYEVKDVKYSGSGNVAAYSTDYYSAMIVYER